jgi:thiol:disulfide interchange protein DsbD
LAWLAWPAAALGPEDVLPPERAYPYKIAAEAGAVIVRWDIQPGHYLYRDRMGFASLTPGIELDAPELPAGIPHEDEFFGRMEIYRGATAVRIPYRAATGAPATLDLEIRSQGCADAGICYPPQTWTASVALPAAGAGLFDRVAASGPEPLANPVSPSPGAAPFALEGAAAGPAQFLPPEQAFRPSAGLAGADTLVARWDIAPGYYLYRDKLGFSVDGGLVQLGAPRLPRGELRNDEFFGESEVYFDALEARIPFVRTAADGGEFVLRVDYQGCAEDGICYPPMSREFPLRLAAAGMLADRAAPADEPLAEQDRLAGVIGSAGLLAVAATFFGLGLLLAFTPCVLPMIPILSGIIVGQGENLSTGRAFGLSVTYVLGMAFTYTLAGALFAAAGQQAQTVFQQPWILAGFSLLFVLLAMSMFGFFELRMPAALQTRIATLSNRQRAGTYAGTAVMGALSALIVTACVMPPLVAALAVIGQGGDVARGALALFALSLGMGVPLIVFGTSAGKLLPRSGAWMETVKAVFGVLLLGVAIWIASRILPGPLTLMLWAALAFVTGVFLGAVEPLTPGTGAGRRLIKGIGLAALAYGAVLLLGAATGGTDPLRPLARAGGSPPSDAGTLAFTRIKTIADLDRELAAAAAAGQPAMLDFYADWCVECRQMEKYTFSDPQVRTALGGMRLLQADVTANDEADRALLRHFGIYGPPTIAFFDTRGRERANLRLVGYQPADEFRLHLQRALAPPGATP